MRYIRRNPFSRETLYRKTVKVQYDTCHWCGSRPAKRRLFLYLVEGDRETRRIAGYFCSLGCATARHEELASI